MTHETPQLGDDLFLLNQGDVAVIFNSYAYVRFLARRARTMREAYEETNDTKYLVRMATYQARLEGYIDWTRSRGEEHLDEAHERWHEHNDE